MAHVGAPLHSSMARLKVTNIAFDEREGWMAHQVLDVRHVTGEQVVKNDHMGAECHEFISKVRTDESGPTRDKDPHVVNGHRGGHGPMAHTRVFEEFAKSPTISDVQPVSCAGGCKFHRRMVHPTRMDVDGPPLKVTVIGTCRVHDTMAAVSEEGSVILNNGGMESFVHSTPEILLRLRVLMGLESYDKQLLPLQVGESKSPRTQPNDDFVMADTDVFVIEVSTLKTVSSQGSPLQFNEVRRHLCTPHGEFGKELATKINDAFNQRKETVGVMNHDVPDDFPTKFHAILEHLRPYVQQEQDIVGDLEEILKLTQRPTLLVNHINVEGTNGRLISSRNRLCNIVKAFCNERGTALFEPATMFETMDRTKLLMDDGQDVNHYAKAELLNVGMKQLEAIRDTIQRSQS